jgi:tRNA uridine 5-carboxymethylaminomethyl modification enzyme
LISDQAWAEYERKQARMDALEQLLTSRKVTPEALLAAGLDGQTSTVGLSWAQLLKRPEVTIEPVLAALGESLAQQSLLAPLVAALATPSATAVLRNEARAVEIEIKFAGYIDQQKKAIEKMKAAESVGIPEWLDYSILSGLSREMREKLERVRPRTIGQAGSIPGLTPAALSLVHVSIRLQQQARAVQKPLESKAHTSARPGPIY